MQWDSKLGGLCKALGNIAICPSPHHAHHVFLFPVYFFNFLFLSLITFFTLFFSLNKVYLVLVKGAELAAVEMGGPLPSPGKPWAFSLGTIPVLGDLTGSCALLPFPIAASCYAA